MPESAARKSWTRVAFGDVVRQVQDRVDPDESGLERFVAGEHMDTDDLRIRRWGTIGTGYLGPAFHMRFKPGHVLYGSRRTYLRKVAVADFEGVTANTTFVIESKDAKALLPDLLPFIMQSESFHEHSKKQSKGSVNPYVNFSDLTWYKFALPPLEDQRRMAAAFLAVHENLESQRTVATGAARVRESYALSLWADPTRSAVFRPLSEVCQKIQDGTHFSPQTSEGEFRYFTSKNIRDGYIDLSDIGWISREEHENIYKRCDVRRGDVLLTKDGANAGNVAINNIEEPFSLLSSVAFIRTEPKVLLPRYVFEYLRSRLGRARVLRHVSGSAITRLTLTQINAIEVPTPCLAEQETSCERFLSLERAVGVAQSRAERLLDVRRRLLREMDGM